MRTPLYPLFCLLILACDPRPPSTGSASDTPPVSNDVLPNADIRPSPRSDAYWDSLYAVCRAEQERQTRWFVESEDLFRREILVPAMDDPSVSAANRQFLMELADFVWGDLAESKFQLPVFERLIMPIFQHEPGYVGLHGNERMSNRPDGILKDITFEGRLQRMHNLELDIESSVMLDSLILLPDIFQQEIGTRAKPVYVYTDKRRTTETPYSFGYRYAACYHYHLYPITTETLTTKDKVLFASRLPLDLVFERRHDVEHILRNTSMPWCSDCSKQDPPEIVFASVQGAEQLVFSYSDTFPYNNVYDNPLRSLLFKLNDSTVVRLWAEDIDLFGCACL